ncbi:MAG: DUF2922 domain-containing protein [Oscillospiraceae bacterium]|nr:DUF2922 domain-containing protein [Oscillospiraceae bacterium]
MTKTTLFIYFKTSSGGDYKLTIKDVREDISASEVSEIAEQIIAKKMFSIKNNSLVEYTKSEIEVAEVTLLK